MAQSLTTPDPLTQPIAENGDKNSIPATSADPTDGYMAQSIGFPPVCSLRLDNGGVAPRRADINGAFNLLSQQTYFLQNGGVYSFRQDISDAIGGYPLNARLWYTDGNGNTFILKSTKQNNTDNFVTTPAYIGTSWVVDVPALSSNNEWTGENTFSGATTPKVSISLSDYTQGNTPASNSSGGFKVNDSSGNELGNFYTRIGTDGDISSRVLSRSLDGSLVTYLSAGFDKDGNEYSHAPSCDSANSIVTTVSKTKSSNGYFKLGNGLIIQWGRWSGSSNPTINFPTAFSNTNYSITMNDERSESNAYATTFQTKQTASVKFHAQASEGNWIAIGY